MLGYGWSTPWEARAAVAADCTVTVDGPGGSQESFQPDSRYAGVYFSATGDHDTLSADGAGGYLLTAADGNTTDFAANGTLTYVQDTDGNRITATYAAGQLTPPDPLVGPVAGDRLQRQRAGRLDHRLGRADDHLRLRRRPAADVRHRLRRPGDCLHLRRHGRPRRQRPLDRHVRRRPAHVLHVRRRRPADRHPRRRQRRRRHVHVRRGSRHHGRRPGRRHDRVLRRRRPAVQDDRRPRQLHLRQLRRQLQPGEGDWPDRPDRRVHVRRRRRRHVDHRRPGRHDPVRLRVQRPADPADRRQGGQDQLRLRRGRRPAQHDLRRPLPVQQHVQPAGRADLVRQPRRPVDHLRLQRRRPADPARGSPTAPATPTRTTPTATCSRPPTPPARPRSRTTAGTS